MCTLRTGAAKDEGSDAKCTEQPHAVSSDPEATEYFGWRRFCASDWLSRSFSGRKCCATAKRSSFCPSPSWQFLVPLRGQSQHSQGQLLLATESIVPWLAFCSSRDLWAAADQQLARQRVPQCLFSCHFPSSDRTSTYMTGDANDEGNDGNRSEQPRPIRGLSLSVSCQKRFESSKKASICLSPSWQFPLPSRADCNIHEAMAACDRVCSTLGLLCSLDVCVVCSSSNWALYCTVSCSVSSDRTATWCVYMIGAAER